MHFTSTILINRKLSPLGRPGLWKKKALLVSGMIHSNHKCCVIMVHFIQRAWEGGNSCCFQPYCAFKASPPVRSQRWKPVRPSRDSILNQSVICFKQISVLCMPSNNRTLKMSGDFILKGKSPWEFLCSGTVYTSLLLLVLLHILQGAGLA